MPHEPSQVSGSSRRSATMAARPGAAWNRRRPHSPAKRDLNVNVRFNASEWELVSANAAGAGLAVGAFLAERGLQPLRQATDSERGRADLLIELMGVHRQLRGAANNLNQAMHAFHAEGRNAAQLEGWAKFVREVTTKVDKLVARVSASR